MTRTADANLNNLQIIVLSGPSGSGKSTVVNRVVAETPVPLMKAVSATTRPARSGEVDGQDYYFLTQEEFDRRREAGEFLECEEVHRSGYWYGTMFSELERIHQAGGWAFLEIDVRGALKVLETFPQAISIFLQAPADSEYERRLRDRGTESESVIQRRLQTVRDELQLATRYKYKVINDQLDRAVSEIADILATREADLHAGRVQE